MQTMDIIYLLIAYLLNIFFFFKTIKRYQKLGKIMINIYYPTNIIFKGRNISKIKTNIQIIKIKNILKIIKKKKSIKFLFKLFLFLLISFFFSDHESLCESPYVTKYFTREELEEINSLDISNEEKLEIVKQKLDEKISIEQREKLLDLLTIFGIVCILAGIFIWFFGGDDGSFFGGFFGDDDDSSTGFSDADYAANKDDYYPPYQLGLPTKNEPWLTEWQKAHYGKPFLRERISPHCVINWLYHHDYDMLDFPTVDKMTQQASDWEDIHIYNKSYFKPKK